MPQITFGDVLTDPILTDLSVGWIQDEGNAVAGNLFPFVPTMEKSGQYAEFNKDFFRREQMARRGLGQEAERADFETSTTTFQTEEWALKTSIDEQLVRASPSVFQLRQNATRYLTQQLLLKIDKDFQSTYFGTGIWGTNLDGSGADFTQFENDSGTPYDLIDEQVDAILKATGFRPNVAIMGVKVFRELKNHSETFNRIAIGEAGGPQRITQGMIANAMGLDRIVVPRLSENTAAEGAAASNSFVFPERDMLLVYAPDSPGMMTPSGGYIFVWSEAFGGQANDLGGVIQRRERSAHHSEEVEIRVEYDMKLVANELGVFLENAVA